MHASSVGHIRRTKDILLGQHAQVEGREHGQHSGRRSEEGTGAKGVNCWRVTKSLQTDSLQHVQTAWRQDRPDTQFAVKELCMGMAMPNSGNMEAFKDWGNV